ncbi:ester cyclase [Mesorhizobium sp. M9A.F.Ca.ET.002.03.1.2]|uniref:ester cyclase n=1 Tax=Mesorhizobium sp. M9A.F.Ca.ET.002.03.1.2 TaxID=2493668 RepID=UPI000F76283F|nr:ester cyclase [Mesorhizobium sp. M9A.F.Ca.ET.002.03.1.2]AZN96010.1 ester cyclase [Mesorhizobium sp. M9A.F.Ca.ET.002.03.1.2]
MHIREFARNFYATIDAQEWDRLSSLVSPDLAVHLGSANPIGFDDWRKSLAEFFVGFPDGHHVIDDYVSAADKVVTRCRFQGTHTGIFHGVEPSGNCVSVGVIHIDRLENGVVVEHFGQLDGLGLLRQIGAY